MDKGLLMSEQLSNFAQYEQDAAEKIARAQAESEQRAIALREEESRQAVIEVRRQSPEVRALNDKAEMEIFGSRGRTYIDPETGAALATAEKPLPGVVDEIATNRRYGQKEAERQAKATQYVKAIKQLTDEGFELSQAKLIMDKRVEQSEKDMILTNKLIALELSKGSTMSKARKMASRRVAHRKEVEGTTDAAIKKRIREEGIFTEAEFDDRTKLVAMPEEPVPAVRVKPAKEESRKSPKKEAEKGEAAPESTSEMAEPKRTRTNPSDHDDNGRTVTRVPRIQMSDSSLRVRNPRGASRPAGPPTSKEELGTDDENSREKPIAPEPAVEESDPTQAPESKGKGSEDASAPANSSADPALHEAARAGAELAPDVAEAAGGEKGAEEPSEAERLQEILKIRDNRLTREQVELLAEAAVRVHSIQDAVYNTDSGTVEPRTQYMLETKEGRVPIDEAVVNSLQRFARAANRHAQAAKAAEKPVAESDNAETRKNDEPAAEPAKSTRRREAEAKMVQAKGWHRLFRHYIGHPSDSVLNASGAQAPRRGALKRSLNGSHVAPASPVDVPWAGATVNLAARTGNIQTAPTPFKPVERTVSHAVAPEDPRQAAQQERDLQVQDHEQRMGALGALDRGDDLTGFSWDFGFDTYRILGREGDSYTIELADKDDESSGKRTRTLSAERVREYLDPAGGLKDAKNFRWQ